MNIPEISNEVKQSLRSESVAHAPAVDKPPTERVGAPVSPEAVNRLNESGAEKQSSNFSRETLESLIAEAEEHLEANDVKLKFNVLEETDTVQVEIVDGDGKTIRKIPGDDLLKLSKSLKNLGKGFLNEVS